MVKELILKASAVGAYVEVIVKADDTLTVTESGGTTATFSSTAANFEQSYGSPTILTVERYQECATSSCRGLVAKWKMSFAFGGSVDVWATSTYEASRESWRRSENEPIWVTVLIPEDLESSSTGMCAVDMNCAFGPTLPYEWCEGDANCLPTTTSDNLFSATRITELETAYGIANGASRRRPPSTCFNRPAKEVDFGFVVDSSGNALRNPPTTGKWIRNLVIANGRHSGAYAAYPTPTYVDIAKYPTPNQNLYYSRAEYDGYCDPGASCGESSWDPYGSYTCTCSNNDPGGCGGAVDDEDCQYDYVIRESSLEASTAEHQVDQECWDWCTGYINDGDQACTARELLQNGGKIYCGYKTGGRTYVTGRNAPNPSRCNVFISAAEMRTVGPFDGSDPGMSRSSGPYLRYHLSEADGLSTGSGLDGTCAPDVEDVCEDSTVTYEAAFAACSRSFDNSTDDHEACINAICLEGCIECQLDPDDDDPGPLVTGSYVPPAIAGDITSTSWFPTASASSGNTAVQYIPLPSTPIKISFPVETGKSVLLLATLGPIKARLGNRNTAIIIIVDDTLTVARTNTGNAYGYNYDSLSMHGVVSGLSAGIHTAEIQFAVRQMRASLLLCMACHAHALALLARAIHPPICPRSHTHMACPYTRSRQAALRMPYVSMLLRV